MATPSPSPNPKLARILDAAYQVFAAKGFHEARIEEIAEQAGVAKGTVYLYFPSKQELYLAMLEELFAAHVRALKARAAGDGDWATRLTVTLAESLTASVSATGLGRFMVNLPPQACEGAARSSFLRVHQEILAVFTGLLAEAQGGCSAQNTVPAEFAALALMGMAQSFVFAHYLAGQMLDPELTARGMVQLLTRGVAPQTIAG